MKIETKFDCEQEVFMIAQNKVFEVEIERIIIEVSELGTERLTYIIKEHPISSSYSRSFGESSLFATKDELLKSL